MRRITIVLAIFLILMPMALAHAGEEQLNETKELIASETPCSQMTEDQLVEIGDYYMEQMHPGEMHETMDEHMGGEGSESLRQSHINMAKRFYCDKFASDTSNHNGWMMGGSHGPGSWWFWGMGMGLWVVIIVALILLIVWRYRNIREKTVERVSPLEVLEKRFARGDITEEEFEERKEELKEG